MDNKDLEIERLIKDRDELLRKLEIRTHALLEVRDYLAEELIYDSKQASIHYHQILHALNS